jgi:hypothetical protein
VQRADVLGLDCVARKEELLTRGPELSAAGGVLDQEKRVGLRAELVAGPSWCPAACFHIFCSDSFSFSVFPIFLHIIYKNASNQFKPLSEIF